VIGCATTLVTSSDTLVGPSPQPEARLAIPKKNKATIASRSMRLNNPKMSMMFTSAPRTRTLGNGLFTQKLIEKELSQVSF
jgi:hypothetical protein